MSGTLYSSVFLEKALPQPDFSHSVANPKPFLLSLPYDLSLVQLFLYPLHLTPIVYRNVRERRVTFAESKPGI